MQVDYLSIKVKNSPVFNLINARNDERNSHLSNDLYKYLKQKSQEKRNFKKYQQNFQKYLNIKLQQEPGKVIGSAFENKQKIKNDKIKSKSRSLKYQENSKAGKGYLRQTKNSVGKNWKLLKLKQNFKRKSNKIRSTSNLSKTQTDYYRTITETSLGQNSVQPPRNPSLRLKGKRFSHQLYPSCSIGDNLQEERKQTDTQVDFYVSALNKLQNETKQIQTSILKDQKRFQIIKQVHQRTSQHFGLLVLQSRQFPDVLFDNPDKLTKIDRYKFSSNYILSNILSKNDSQVQEWIQNEKIKMFRKNSKQLTRDPFQKNFITKEQIKLLKKISQVHNSKEKEKLQNHKIQGKNKTISVQKINGQQMKKYERQRLRSKGINELKRHKDLVIMK